LPSADAIAAQRAPGLSCLRRQAHPHVAAFPVLCVQLALSGAADGRLAWMRSARCWHATKALAALSCGRRTPHC